MVYYRILNADPCVVQSDLVIYPSYINWFASSHPELPVCPSPTHPPLGTSKSALRVCEPASASWVSSLVSCFGCCLCLTKPTVDLGAHSTLHSVAPVHRATHQLSCRLTKKLLTECGPLEKGMANHFSILTLRTPWTEWKGKMIGYWKGNSPGQ